MAKTKGEEKKPKLKTIRMGFDSNIISMLKRLNEPFELEISNSTIKIIKQDGDKYILSAKDLSFKSLAFIKNVKSDGTRFGGTILPFYDPKHKYTKLPVPVLDSTWNTFKLFLPKVRAKDINYFRWNNINEGVYRDVYEVDVNNAYWNVAFSMGVISPATYTKGLNEMDKMDRLIGLGSMATMVECFKYNPETGKIEHVKSKVNETTRNIFFNIAKRIDNLLNGIFEKAGSNNLLFYWVDAMFCRKYSLDFIKGEFDALGIEYKVKEIQSMNVYKKGREKKVCMLEVKEKNDSYYVFEQRFFSIPPPKEERMEFLKEMFAETLAGLETEKQLSQMEIDGIIDREKYGDNVPF